VAEQHANYAKRTKVPAERTRHEIEELMRKRGADQFFSASDARRVWLAFRINGRHIRFTLPMPEGPSPQLVRSRWRALLLVVKAKLEAVDICITTLEEAFIGETVLPNKQTVAEYMAPQLETTYASGKMPPLLPWYGKEAQ
jgi:hypothetical protein